MNLTWHVVRKDIRRLRAPLALWLAMLLLKLVLLYSFFGPAAALQSTFESRQILLGSLCLLESTVSYFLVALLVLEDAPVGASVAWATRPISGARLLAAKAIGAALLFWILPALFALPWWWYTGLEAPDLTRAGWWIILLQAFIVVPAFAIAALTGKMGRFLLWTVAVALAIPLLFIIVNARREQTIDLALEGWRTDLVIAAVLLPALAAGVMQYLGRRPAQSAAVVTLGLLVAIVIGLYLPGGPGLRERLSPLPLMPGSEKTKPELSQAVLVQTNARNSLQLTFRLRDVPADIAFTGGRLSAEFRWADGTVLRKISWLQLPWAAVPADRALGLPEAKPDPETQRRIEESRQQTLANLAARGTPFVKNVDGPWREFWTCVLPLSPEEAALFRASAPTADLELTVTGGFPVGMLEMPFVAGEERRGHGGRLRLVEAAFEPTRGRSSGSEQLRATWIFARGARFHGIRLYQLDRSTGYQMPSEWYFMSRLGMPGVLGTQVERQSTWVRSPMLWRTDRWVSQPNWQATTTIAALGIVRDSQFTRELHVDQVPVSVKTLP